MGAEISSSQEKSVDVKSYGVKKLCGLVQVFIIPKINLPIMQKTENSRVIPMTFVTSYGGIFFK